MQPSYLSRHSLFERAAAAIGLKPFAATRMLVWTVLVILLLCTLAFFLVGATPSGFGPGGGSSGSW